MTLYIENPKDSTRKLLEIINDYSKVAGYKIIDKPLSLSKPAVLAAAAAKLLQSCPLCDSIDGSLPGSPVPGILQARTLEWVATSFSKV